MMISKVITIGVYGFSEDDFFTTLREAQVDTFCDVRARRGMRGSTYAFANSNRLQERLSQMGIHYLHAKDLSPSLATRQVQYDADKQTDTSKRKREALDDSFMERYVQERLASFDAEAFAETLGTEANVIALFCVEAKPTACHRSLIAERLHKDLGVALEHLVP
jgi:uncharacterized protein (DUF488 family)